MKQKEHSDYSAFDKYMKEINRIPNLSLEEEIRLFKELKKCQEDSEKREKIRDIIIKSNLLLVVGVAKKYWHNRHFKFEDRYLEFEDLIGHGNIGLIKATHKYNPQKRLSFGKYAKGWIKSEIRKEIFKGRYFGRREETEKKLLRIKEFWDKHVLNNKRQPTYELLKENIGVHKDTYDLFRTGCAFNKRVTSLEKNSESSYLIEIIVEKKYKELDLIIQEKELKDIILEGVNELEPIEKTVIIKNYGLYENPEHSYQMIGKIINRTKEGVRFIRNRALDRLKEEIILPEVVDAYLSR